MIRKLVAILAFVVGIVFLTLAILIWLLVSRLSSGYEVSDSKVVFRTFNNLNWKVERHEVASADPGTFKSIRSAGGLYGLDRANVFFESTLITDADPTTFEVLDWREEFSKDTNRAYWKSIRVSSEPANFQVLTRGYSKDSKHVFYASKIVEGADPSTFVVTGSVTSEANDKTHEYNMGHRKRDE